MNIEAFAPYHHWRICYQLLSDPHGKTFAAYIGVLESGERQMDFAPALYRGGGRVIPAHRKEKVDRQEAMNFFSLQIAKLEQAGYVYCD